MYFISVSDLPLSQLGLGSGPEIQGAQNHESAKKKKKKKKKKERKKKKRKKKRKEKQKEKEKRKGKRTNSEELNLDQ